MQNIMFGLPSKYDTGVTPSICLNDNNFYLEVHKSENNANLYFNYGQIGLTSSNHLKADPIKKNSVGKTGYRPAVYFNTHGNAVVVVQNSDSAGNQTLNCLVGVAGSSDVSWGSMVAIPNVSGMNPAVILDASNNVLLVFERSDSTVHMLFGTLDANHKTISWQTSAAQYGNGNTPRLALRSDGKILETRSYSGQIYYSLGTVDFSGKQVTWITQNGHLSIYGHNPCAGFSSGNLAIILYQVAKEDYSHAHAGAFLTSLLARLSSGSADVYETRIKIGEYGTNGITWRDDRFLGWGSVLSVSANANFGMIAQLGGATIDDENELDSNDSDLTFYLSRILDVTDFTDRANWMQNNCRSRKIRNLMMPGAHDAGMYTIHDCTTLAGEDTTQTQNKNFLQMLECGIRYFDIRPSYFQSTFYARHASMGQGCYGGAISDILADVATFVAAHKEVVFLKFSHYDNIDATKKTQLEGIVHDTLSDYLLTSTGGSRISAMEIQDIVTGDTGVVIPLFDALESHDPGISYTGLYSYKDYDPSKDNATAADMVVFDSYADDDSFTDMVSDQLDKLHDSDNHGGDLFLLSWTLTQQFWEWDEGFGTADQVDTSILDFANLANHGAQQTLSSQQQKQKITKSTLPNIVYVDFCDNFVTDICIWLNQCFYDGYINS